jgi:hypothetical protein
MIRGLNPASTADQRFKTDYDDAVAWLDKVQRQQAHPLVTLALNASPQIQPSLTTFSVVATATGCTARNRGW